LLSWLGSGIYGPKLPLLMHLRKGYNATFNNISVISWRSVLMVEETTIPGKKHQSAAGH